MAVLPYNQPPTSTSLMGPRAPDPRSFAPPPPPNPNDPRVRPMNTVLSKPPARPAAAPLPQPKFQPSLSQQPAAPAPVQQNFGATIPNSGAAAGSSGPMPQQIQTSITPQNIYSDEQTQRYLNEERDRLAVARNPSFLKKQMMRPGSSLGWGQAAQVAPQIAELQSQSVGLGAAIPFGDMQANMQHLRQGQQARDQEAQGLATIGQTGLFAEQQNALNNQNTLLRLLQGLV